MNNIPKRHNFFNFLNDCSSTYSICYFKVVDMRVSVLQRQKKHTLLKI